MEQATNQFTKGLQMDTHPMVQGNDTLTDCLNGTLITMSGDEVILQNDMGNRRVDQAFLPAGYEPIGMKEYGGIIYIAAYNPITNKSQIGSFPSPQRKYISDVGIDQSINLVTCNSDNDNWLKTAPILLPLSKKNIHVGDKFAFCFSSNDIINQLSNYNNITSRLSNYNNTNNGKIKSPKNKLYTLSIGVLDEYGKFYDITSRLCRYKGSGIPVSYTNNESDLYKFNDGYFIASSSTDLTSSNVGFLSSADQDLAESRFMKIYGNTYSEKFTGPLYLKIEQNYIQDFTYNLEAYKTEKTINDKSTVIIKLKITGKLIYNCPDGCIDESETDDTTYEHYKTNPYSLPIQTYDDGTKVPNFKFFKFFASIEGNNKTEQTEKTSTVNVIYNKVTNLYTATVTQNYEFLAKGNEIFSYDIKVMANSECDTTYIKELSSLDNLFDASKINSNQLSLTGWKFTNDSVNKETTIKYSLEAYPSKNVRFENLTMVFTDVEDNSKIYTASGLSINNGINKVTINWDEVGLSFRKLYDVELKYIKVNALTGEILSPESQYIIKRIDFESQPIINYFDDHLYFNGTTVVIKNPISRMNSRGARDSNSSQNSISGTDIYSSVEDSEKLWLLTTELLNECYDNSSISNFCETNAAKTELANQEIKNKLNIKYKIKFPKEDIVVTQLSDEQKRYIGTPVSFNKNSNIKYACEHYIQLKVTGKYKIEYEEELYPSFVTIDIKTSQETSQESIAIDKDGAIINIINQMKGSHQMSEFYIGNSNNFNVSNLGTNIILHESNHTFETTDMDIYYYDYIFGQVSENTRKDITIKKAVVPVSDIFSKLFPKVVPQQSGGNVHGEFVSPSIDISYQYTNGSTGQTNYYYTPGLLDTVNPLDDIGQITFYSTMDNNQESYDGLQIMNYIYSYGSNLFTYTSPYQHFDQFSGPLEIKFYQNNSNVSIKGGTENTDICRIFIKTKFEQSNSFMWKLVKINSGYYIQVPNTLTYIPSILQNKICNYNKNGVNKPVYIFTNLDDNGENGRRVTIYYSNNLIKTGNNTINASLSIMNSDTDENHIEIKNSITHLFTNALTKNLTYSDSIEFAKISTSSDDLDRNIAALLQNNSSEILGMIVLDSNNNNINYTIIDEYNRQYYDNNFYKFYYLENNEFKPLNSKISLGNNCLQITQGDINRLQTVYDKYEFNDAENYETSIYYSDYIDLDNFLIYSE